jgi:hypothetical protein
MKPKDIITTSNAFEGISLVDLIIQQSQVYLQEHYFYILNYTSVDNNKNYNQQKRRIFILNQINN